MTDEPPRPDERQAARNKRFGRIMLIAMGLLLLLYFVPSFLRAH